MDDRIQCFTRSVERGACEQTPHTRPPMRPFFRLSLGEAGTAHDARRVNSLAKGAEHGHFRSYSLMQAGATPISRQTHPRHGFASGSGAVRVRDLEASEEAAGVIDPTPLYESHFEARRVRTSLVEHPVKRTRFARRRRALMFRPHRAAIGHGLRESQPACAGEASHLLLTFNTTPSTRELRAVPELNVLDWS